MIQFSEIFFSGPVLPQHAINFSGWWEMEMFFVSGRMAFGWKVSGAWETKHEIERSILKPNIHIFVLIEGGCKSRVVGCGPDCWSVVHASCQSGHCSCLPGYLPQFTPHPSPRLAMCVSATFNASLQGGDNKSQGGDIKIHYYPGKFHHLQSLRILRWKVFDNFRFRCWNTQLLDVRND